MPRKQPLSMARTVYQVRWTDPTRWESDKSETFYKERAARDRFDELSRTGARVRLFQTLRPVKLTMVDECPFDAGAREAYLESEAVRRNKYFERKRAKRDRKQTFTD